MKLGQAGLDLIKQSEGYHRALKNGDCIAYRCPAGVLTIGFGTTSGVREGMVWTRKQAEEVLQKEIDTKYGAAVDRLVTATINQNQRDALVSLCYNIGEGGLAKSGVLKLTNAGKFQAAAKQFAPWNKARAGGGGPLVVMPGLVTRRAREAALYLTPVAEEAADEPLMPQAIEPPKQQFVEHLEAHEQLKQESWFYSAKRWVMKTLGIPVAGGTAGVGLLSNGDTVSTIGTMASFVQSYGLVILGGCVAAIVVIELMQALQRARETS